jgi:hypothetical protein
VCRGEVALSSVAFLIFGGTATVVLVAFSDLEPQLFFMYISNTAGSWIRPGQQVADVFLFGTGGNRLIQAVVICAAVAPLLLFPALVAAWVTRGRRLKLMKVPEAASRAKRIRIPVSSLMVLVACAAIDFVLIRAFRNVQSENARTGLFGALPMAHVLAVYLAIVVSNLVRPGEVTLSKFAFLVCGGTGILILMAFFSLAPTPFFTFINYTEGLLLPSGQNASTTPGAAAGPALFIRAILRWALIWADLTLPVLVAALLAGWLTRGYRLNVLDGPQSQSDASPDRQG